MKIRKLEGCCSVAEVLKFNRAEPLTNIMVTISNTPFNPDLSLVSILSVMTKIEMLNICKKLDLYVSPNLKKEVTARRVAQEILCKPLQVLEQLCKSELQLLDKIEKAGSNQYVVVKMRKTPYKLLKFGKVLTSEDYEKGEWHLLMPNCVRESLATSYPAYLDMAMTGVKAPSAKELRIMVAFQRYRGGG